MMKTKLFVEQHFHGCYGVDFNTASKDDVLALSKEILKEGVGFIFPTLVTDSVENLKKQINVIKSASESQTSDMAKICGVHLEGVFLNPEKCGIHNPKYFLNPSVDNYKLLDDDFIKIVTLAPELSDVELLDYLKSRQVKIQAGHCVGTDLSYCDATTHTFNAMGVVNHKCASTATSALLNDNLFSEVIADGVHVCDDVLKLLFKIKQMNKILLVSDCLPCTRSELTSFNFAGEEIFYDGNKATSKDGVLAGSTMLLPDIVKVLSKKDMFSKQYIANSYDYHGIHSDGEIIWDNDFNIVEVKY